MLPQYLLLGIAYEGFGSSADSLRPAKCRPSSISPKAAVRASISFLGPGASGNYCSAATAMSSHSEIDRRKALRREAEEHTRADEEGRMPLSRSQLAELFDHLDVALRDGCDHTNRFTRAFLNGHRLSEATIIPWLAEYGGHCDCEVLANVEERWGRT